MKKKKWTCAYDGTNKKLQNGRCAACGRASQKESVRDAKAWDESVKPPHNSTMKNKCGCETKKDVLLKRCESHPKPQHTPTPWKLSENDPTTILGKGSDSKPYTVVIAEAIGYESQCNANAAYIVKTVNAHEFILGSLKEAVEHDAVYGTNPALLDLFRQAIAKAESVSDNDPKGK